jgi:hydroxymethylpyrimidine pyrophosphatase-like HAD family hydrolase
MDIVLFSDLDDTVIKTSKKINFFENDCTPVSWDENNCPLSFITSKNKFLLSVVQKNAQIVWVTGRNTKSLKKLSLPAHSFVVSSFGAFIFNCLWNPVFEYNKLVNRYLENLKSEIVFFYKLMQNFSFDLPVKVKIVCDCGSSVYISIKEIGDSSSHLNVVEKYASQIISDKFYIHRNSNNIAIIPKEITKKNAVRYLIENTFDNKQWITIGVGDSYTDWSFMATCDWAIVPNGSQISLKNSLLYN